MHILAQSAARTLSWFGPQRASSTESPDSVVLGEERPTGSRRIAPALVAEAGAVKTPAPEGQLAMAFLTGLRRQLIAGGDLDKPMQAELGRQAHGQGHPLAARLARVLLDDHGHYDSALEMWTAEAGDPVAYLERQHERLTEDRSQPDRAFALHLDVWGQFLDHLQERPMTPTALRTVVHLWAGLEDRARLELDVREEEPAQEDLKMAQRCRALVETWVQSGQAQLVGGRLDDVGLGAAVSGNRIEVHPRPLDIAHLDPAEPDPTARLLAEGRLGREGGELASALGELIKRYPQLEEAGYVSRNLLPLLFADQVGPSYAAQSCLIDLFERRPELMSPVLQELCQQHRGVYLPEPVENTIKVAGLKLGWRPDTPEQVAWVAGKLFQSRGGQSGEHLMRSSDEFTLAAQLLQDCPAELLATLPLSTSLPAAVLDHLLEVGTDDRVLDVWNRDVEETVYPWLVGDRAESLLSGLETAHQQAGSLEALSPRARATLALLHQDPENRPRLYALLEGELESQPQHRATRRMVDAARLHALEQGPERLRQLSGSERAGELERLLRLNALLGEEVPDPPWPDRVEAYENQLPSERSAPLLAALDQAERSALAGPALARFEEGYRQAGSLEELGPEGRASLSLLSNLWSEQPQLSEKLLTLLRPELESGTATVPAELEALVDSFVAEEANRAVSGFAGQDLPERLASYHSCLKLAQASSDQQALEQTIQDGFCAQARAHPVLSGLVDADELDASLAVLHELAQDPDGWASGADRYLELQARLPSDGMQVYQQARDLRRQGMPWEAARELALRRHLKVPDRTHGAMVELSPGKVTVGGVVVRERRRT